MNINDFRQGISELRKEIERLDPEGAEALRRQRRGFDIIPQDSKGKCGRTILLRRLVPITVCLFGIIFSAKHYEYCIKNGCEFIVWLALTVFSIFLLLELIKAFKLLTGRFELYGGRVMRLYEQSKSVQHNKVHGKFKKGVKEKDKYMYFYKADINGVSVTIGKLQLYCLREGGYYYVVRLKSRKKENDKYYFIKAPDSLEELRSGNFYP